MSGMIYVSATIVAKDGMESALETILAGVVETVRSEDGCLRYDLHKSDYGNVFLFYEIWESMAALAAHGKSSHMLALKDATANLVARPTEVNTWQAVDVI